VSATRRERPPRAAVIGLGNVLLGDDGFGPCVVEHLRTHWDFPDTVVLIDGGTPGLGLVTLLAGFAEAILIDCVAAPGEPGDLRSYGLEELFALPLLPRVSPHDPAVREALGFVRLSGAGPEHVHLVGVVPGSVATSTELSPTVAAAVAPAAERVVAILAEASLRAVGRREPRRPEGWWQVGALGAAR
jgi:hydrogenase maturation protease